MQSTTTKLVREGMLWVVLLLALILYLDKAFELESNANVETAEVVAVEVDRNPYALENERLAALIRQRYPKTENAETLVEYHREMSMKYHVPIAVGLGISDKESNFRNVMSYNDSSMGQMQVNWKAWKGKIAAATQHELLNDERKNIESGYQILALNIEKSKTLEAALGRYYGCTIPEENVKYAKNALWRIRLYEDAARGIGTLVAMR